MSVTGEIKNLYSDKDKTRVLLPRTKTKAVSDENGTSLDVLLDGKAPAEYGLGAVEPYCSDANKLVGNGWFGTDGNTANLPDYIKGTGGHILTIGGTQIFVQTTLHTKPSLAIRKESDGSWSNWQYLNPEMEIGKVYETTERYQGRPVYARIIDFGALPNNDVKQVAYSSGSAGAVSLTAVLSDGCVIHGGVGRDLNISRESTITLDCTCYNIRIRTDADFSSLTAYVLVKFL